MKRKIKFVVALVFSMILGAACSKTPQLPSTCYNPQLVLFGVLAPGNYEISTKEFYTALRYNFFVVQRTYRQGERLLLLPMTNVKIYLDSIQMKKVGDLREGTDSPDGHYVLMKTPIYSFDQKAYAIQPGKRYTVRVTAPGYQPISATTVVPQKPIIVEPTDSTISVSKEKVTLKWKMASGTAGYRVQVWCHENHGGWPCDEKWLNSTVNTYVIEMEYLTRSPGDTIWVDVQALDQNYVNYLSQRESFFSTCLTQSDFDVKNGYGVLGSLNAARKRLLITK